MSNPVKDRSGLGKAPKAERRAAGKLAAARRARDKRRKKLLTNALYAVVAIGLIVGLVALFGAFDSNTPDPQASASPSDSAPAGSQLPADADPALQTKPTTTAGEGDLTQLKVTTIIDGTGAVVQSGQTISVNYVGVSYTTGEEFDSSWSRSQPVDFAIGVGAVIPGWDQGLVGVKIGSRVQLDIPTDLAYGPTAAADGKPPGPLRFIVDVLSAT